MRNLSTKKYIENNNNTNTKLFSKLFQFKNAKLYFWMYDILLKIKIKNWWMQNHRLMIQPN